MPPRLARYLMVFVALASFCYVPGFAKLYAQYNGYIIVDPDCPDGQCGRQQQAPSPWTAPPQRSLIPREMTAMPAHLRAATVRIETHQPKRLGSGSIIASAEQHALVLTCFHTVDGTDGAVTVHTHDGRALVGQLVGTDRALDLAAVSIANPKIEPLALAESGPPQGATCYSMGYGGDGRFAANTGTAHGYVFARFDNGNTMTDALEISGAARMGDSGGPMVNAQFDQVGVIVGTTETVVSATACHRIRGFLARLGARFKSRRSSPDNSLPDDLAAKPPEKADDNLAGVGPQVYTPPPDDEAPPSPPPQQPDENAGLLARLRREKEELASKLKHVGDEASAKAQQLRDELAAVKQKLEDALKPKPVEGPGVREKAKDLVVDGAKWGLTALLVSQGWPIGVAGLGGAVLAAAGSRLIRRIRRKRAGDRGSGIGDREIQNPKSKIQNPQSLGPELVSAVQRAASDAIAGAGVSSAGEGSIAVQWKQPEKYNEYNLSPAYADDLAAKRANQGMSTGQQALLSQIQQEALAKLQRGDFQEAANDPRHLATVMEHWIMGQFLAKHNVRTTLNTPGPLPGQA
jgi:hypothetical protein